MEIRNSKSTRNHRRIYIWNQRLMLIMATMQHPMFRYLQKIQTRLTVKKIDSSKSATFRCQFSITYPFQVQNVVKLVMLLNWHAEST